MEFNLDQPDVLHNPYPMYAAMRAFPGIARVNSGFARGALMVTRYDDVAFVLKDPRFVNDQRKMPNWHGWTKNWYIPGPIKNFINSMVMMDEPDHTRLRRLVHKAFTPQRIAIMSTSIERIAHDLLDRAARRRQFDFMRDFAEPLPLNVIGDMMGISHQDRRNFRRWMSNTINDFSMKRPHEIPGKLLNAIALDKFLKRLVEERRQHPTDDLTSALVQAEADGDTLTEAELIAMLFLILFAGHETTVNLIGTGTLGLLQQPDQLALLKSRPELMEPAIEELLRFGNPVQHIAQRYAIEEVEIGGTVVPQYSMILIGTASANRDETIFSDPERIDITRSPNRHLAFGFGVHYCVGAPLARLEASIAFRVLFERMPGLRLMTDPAALRWRGGPSLRGLRALPVAAA